MNRCRESELLERDEVPDALAARAYRDLTRIHRYLGTPPHRWGAAPRSAAGAARVGCGVRPRRRAGRRAKRLGVEVVGVDVKSPGVRHGSIPIIQADATRDPLPMADVAFSMYLGHHLSDDGLVALIRNVGRSCRRFILLDLVRHRLPLALFRLFVAPLASPIVAIDGRISIRRSYTGSELECLVGKALAGSASRSRHSIAPLWIRQVADISYAQD